MAEFQTNFKQNCTKKIQIALSKQNGFGSQNPTMYFLSGNFFGNRMSLRIFDEFVCEHTQIKRNRGNKKKGKNEREEFSKRYDYMECVIIKTKGCINCDKANEC